MGLHPFTGIPLGTLATPEIRRARSAAKDAFNPLWQRGGMSRTEAYAWLAQALGIANVEECHIGWFGVQQCAAVIAAVRTRDRPSTQQFATTGPKAVSSCGCDVLPWEDCIHTRQLEGQHQ